MRKIVLFLLFDLILIPVIGQSVSKQLISNNSQIEAINDSTVSDIDGNVYHTVTIGTQTWMIENLNTTRFRNGDKIPNIKVDSIWEAINSAAYCEYNNDTEIAEKIGKLYNWYSIADSRNLAPMGWHVSTYADWTILDEFLKINGYNNEGLLSENKESNEKIAKTLASKSDWMKCKDKGTIGNDLTTNNLSGFKGLPGGYRHTNGSFRGYKKIGYWWNYSETDNLLAWSRSLS